MSNWHDQRGSIAPVAVMLFAAVFILVGFVLEREWVNYRIRLLEQTADFAAEAGAQYFDVHYYVNVRQQQHYTDWYWVCDEWDKKVNPWKCVRDHQEPFTNTRYRDKRIEGTQEQLERTWHQQADCGTSPWDPAWQCLDWTVVSEHFQFRAEAQTVAEHIFELNLPTHARPTVHERPRIDVIADNPFDPNRRSVKITVNARLGSLLGLGTREKEVVSKAVSQYQPLRLE